MNPRHIQEMSVWPKRSPRIDPEAASFFRGVIVGMAVSMPLWVLLVLAVW